MHYAVSGCPIAAARNKANAASKVRTCASSDWYSHFMSSSDHTTSWEANPYEIKVPIFGRSLCANFTDKSPASQVDNYSQYQVKKKSAVFVLSCAHVQGYNLL